jgi:hypothetical protein
MISRAFAALIPRAGLLLFAAAITVLLFLISLWLIKGHSLAAFSDSAQTTLSLLMAMDSPKNLLPHMPWLIAAGWLVSLAGWLFFPLLVTQIFDNLLTQQGLEAEYAVKLRALGAELGLSGQELDDFVIRATEAKNLVFSRLRKK